MTFQPILPAGGLVGWRILQASYPAQAAALKASPQTTRLADHFRQKMPEAVTPEALVADRRLLQVALGAFGLDDDINNKAFIARVLRDGVAAPDALANRLTDQRYRDLAQAFGYDRATGPAVSDPGFADRILSQFEARQFEQAVGNSDPDMRLAMNARREIEALARTSLGDDTRWFRVLGTPPLRQVFEAVLNLPASMAGIDLDKQVDVFRDRLQSRFGGSEISHFANPDEATRLAERFLLQRQVAQGAALSSGSVALTLLGA